MSIFNQGFRQWDVENLNSSLIRLY